MDKDISKELEIAMAAIDKSYGKGTIFRLDSDEIREWPSISTGAPTLDLKLGIGGIPMGRLTEVYGPESCGKTTLCLSILAQAHKQGWMTAFIDSEHALDPGYARSIGVDLSKVLISQPDYGEQALDIAEDIIKTGEIKVIIIDSVAALTPRAELEGDMEAQQMGLQARMMSKAMRRLPQLCSQHNVALVFVNQVREKIGIAYGNPIVTPGGRGLKFATSVRIELRKSGDHKAKDGSGQTGIEVTAKIVKNKMAPPFKIAEYSIMYGKGIDEIGCIYDLALENGIFMTAGAWIKWAKPLLDYEEGQSFAQGRDNAVLSLTQDLDLVDAIKKELNLK